MNGVVGKLTEKKFTDMVMKLASLCGWRTLHLRPGLNRRGKWQTAVQGDGAGFPDLLLLKGPWQIAAELKVDKNESRPEQTAWLEAFAETGAFSYCWRPEMWNEIEAVLRDGPTGGNVP